MTDTRNVMQVGSRRGDAMSQHGPRSTGVDGNVGDRGNDESASCSRDYWHYSRETLSVRQCPTPDGLSATRRMDRAPLPSPEVPSLEEAQADPTRTPLPWSPPDINQSAVPVLIMRVAAEGCVDAGRLRATRTEGWLDRLLRRTIHPSPKVGIRGKLRGT